MEMTQRDTSTLIHICIRKREGTVQSDLKVSVILANLNKVALLSCDTDILVWFI